MNLWKAGPTARVLALNALILACACTPASTTRGQPAPSAAPVLAATTGWTAFTDPTENAFTVSVPAGWKVMGGVKRSSEIAARPWVTAASANGGVSFFRGDPSLPIFYVMPDLPSVPAAQRRVEGQVLQTPNGPTPVHAYQAPAAFAADYARKTYGPACSGFTPQGESRAEPDLANHELVEDLRISHAMGSEVPDSATHFEGASVRFACKAGAAPYVLAVFVVMAKSQVGDSGLWSPRLLFGYRAPAATADATDQVARAINASFQRKPAWEGSMIEAGRRTLARQKAEFEAQHPPPPRPYPESPPRHRGAEIRYMRENACPTTDQAAHDQCVAKIEAEPESDPQ